MAKEYYEKSKTEQVASAQAGGSEGEQLMAKNGCNACHAVDTKIVGPAFKDVAKKGYTAEQIVSLIYKPNPANWPDYPPMPPMSNVPKDEAEKLANWTLSLK